MQLYSIDFEGKIIAAVQGIEFLEFIAHVVYPW